MTQRDFVNEIADKLGITFGEARHEGVANAFPVIEPAEDTVEKLRIALTEMGFTLKTAETYEKGKILAQPAERIEETVLCVAFR